MYRLHAAAPLYKHLLVDPHERACVVGLALVLNAVEAVSPLAVVPLVVVVVLHLPNRLKHPQLCELKQKHVRRLARVQTNGYQPVRAATFDEAVAERSEGTDEKVCSHSKLTSPETHTSTACVK